jgi:hypothetical protein
VFVRFQSPTPNRHGWCPGVFGLVNGLAFDGLLTAEEERFRRTNNDWYNANVVNPTDVDPTVYDRVLNPCSMAVA